MEAALQRLRQAVVEVGPGAAGAAGAELRGGQGVGRNRDSQSRDKQKMDVGRIECSMEFLP